MDMCQHVYLDKRTDKGIPVCKQPAVSWSTKGYCAAHSLLHGIIRKRQMREHYGQSYDITFALGRFSQLDKAGQAIVLAELPADDAKKIVGKVKTIASGKTTAKELMQAIIDSEKKADPQAIAARAKVTKVKKDKEHRVLSIKDANRELAKYGLRVRA